MTSIRYLSIMTLLISMSCRNNPSSTNSPSSDSGKTTTFKSENIEQLIIPNLQNGSSLALAEPSNTPPPSDSLENVKGALTQMGLGKGEEAVWTLAPGGHSAKFKNDEGQFHVNFVGLQAIKDGLSKGTLLPKAGHTSVLVIDKSNFSEVQDLFIKLARESNVLTKMGGSGRDTLTRLNDGTVIETTRVIHDGGAHLLITNKGKEGESVWEHNKKMGWH